MAAQMAWHPAAASVACSVRLSNDSFWLHEASSRERAAERAAMSRSVAGEGVGEAVAAAGTACDALSFIVAAAEPAAAASLFVLVRAEESAAMRWTAQQGDANRRERTTARETTEQSD